MMYTISNGKTRWMVFPAAAMVLLAGCKEDEAALAPAPVDLSQTEDLFAEPIQANPLTSDPAAVVVRVNGEAITRGEILELVGSAMQQVAGRVPPQQMQQIQGQMYQQFKNDLITRKLMEAAVAEANVAVTDEELEQALENIRERVPEGASLEEALAAQGMTMDSLKDNILNDLKTRKFLEAKTAGVEPATEEEAKEFYDANPDRFKKPENVAASHILVKFDEGETEEGKAAKKARIDTIRSDILAGTVSFEDAAKQHSGCPSSAQGGSLGTFGKGQMVPEFEVAAFTQEPDEVGDVVETQFGYHLIKVTGHHYEGTVSFDEAKEQVMAFLGAQKKQQIIADFVESLRDGATIEEIE